MDIVVNNARGMELKAQQQEQRMRQGGKTAHTDREAIQKVFEVNDMYVNSVQAKLKLLSDF
jgi:hypothetical protein